MKPCFQGHSIRRNALRHSWGWFRQSWNHAKVSEPDVGREVTFACRLVSEQSRAEIFLVVVAEDRCNDRVWSKLALDRKGRQEVAARRDSYGESKRSRQL